MLRCLTFYQWCVECHKVAYWHGTLLFSIYVNNVPAVIETCSTVRVLPWWHEKNSLLYEGCPILPQIYAWHNVFYCIYSTVQKHNKKKRPKQNNEKFKDAMHKFVGVLDKYVLYMHSRLGMSCYWGYKLMIT